jgi:hypothetical protein
MTLDAVDMPSKICAMYIADTLPGLRKHLLSWFGSIVPMVLLWTHGHVILVQVCKIDNTSSIVSEHATCTDTF